MLKKTYRLRLLLLCVLSVIVFLGIEIRLYYIQIVLHDHFTEKALQNQIQTVTLPPRRGDILDRHGDPLATSYFANTIILDTRKIVDLPGDEVDNLVSDLAALLDCREDTLRATHFARPGRRILASMTPDRVTSAAMALDKSYKLPMGTLVFHKRSKRDYPYDSLASHVVGYTRSDEDGDNHGVAGIEREYDEWLKGSYAKDRIQVNSGQQGLSPLADEVVSETFGANVVLTIDKQVQMFTEKALRKRVGEVQALGGVAVVMDVATGEILALANCPDYDPNRFNLASDAERRNRALTDPIEIGSVMKILTASLLLDNGLLSVDEMVNCYGGVLKIDGRTLTDTHPHGFIPFREAFAESSNIALATLGLRLEPTLYYRGLTSFGMGQVTGIDLPGEDHGTLYPVEKWTKLSRTSLPIGFESELTAIQVVTALGTVANHGVRLRPHVVKEIRTQAGRVIKQFGPEPVMRVISDETARLLLSLMKGVVTGGTGEEAQVPGYEVGGKTGTTPKQVAKTGRTYRASFAGLLPIDNPRLAIYIYIDEPQTGEIYGGKVAAPVFAEIALRTAPLIGIPPSDPVAFAKARAALDGATTAQVAAAAPTTTRQDDAAEMDDAAPAPALPPEMSAIEVPGSKPMPRVMGQTMSEAWKTLADAGIEAKMLGSGVVVQQEPRPDKKIAPDAVATLIFAHPSEAMTTSTETTKPGNKPIKFPRETLKTTSLTPHERIQ